MRRWATVIAITLAASGCGTPPPPGAGIALAPMQYDFTNRVQVPLGAELDLVKPPQGGFVVFIGARVQHLLEDTVELRGRLRDAAGEILAEDSRTILMQAPADDPAASVPDLNSYFNVSNIAVCPSASPTDRHNLPLTVEVVVTELKSRRTGTGTVQTTLVCRQTDPTQLKLCQCECAGGYFLGKCT
jgi:hypothetical protein